MRQKLRVQSVLAGTRSLNPNSEVGEHTRLGCGRLRLAAGILRAGLSRTLESFRCDRFFREGAENSARGGRDPQASFRLETAVQTQADGVQIEVLVLLETIRRENRPVVIDAQAQFNARALKILLRDQSGHQ